MVVLAAILAFLKAVWKYFKLFVWFCVDNWKVVLPIFALILVLIFGLKWWHRHTAKLDEKQIEAAKQAIAEHNDEHLKQVFAEADAKQAVIDGTVANSEVDAKKAEAAAKKQLDSMTHDQLQAEAERRFQESQ